MKKVMSEFDDPHFHPRDDDSITEMVMDDLLSSGFIRGIPIFNYKNPVETAWHVERERERLHRIAPKFEIIPSIMLTRNTTPQIVRDTCNAGAKVIKWIPDLLSTNSNNGVSWANLHEKYPCYYEAERLDMGAMIHVEDSLLDALGNPITHPVFREDLALRKFDVFARLFPDMPISLEHVSTKRGMDYIWNEAPPNVRAGITTHHLFRTIYDVYDRYGCIRPDEWCMLVYKFFYDQESLIQAAISGDPKFFYASRQHTETKILGIHQREFILGEWIFAFWQSFLKNAELWISWMVLSLVLEQCITAFLLMKAKWFW